MDRVDILLATYNGERFLKEQIESILTQTYRNFRLLISDDCSTDRTWNILNYYAGLDNRILIHRNERNVGIVNNFEFLLKQVQSEFFMFSDQDDVWKIDKIEKSINKIKQDNAGLVHTDLEVVDENLNTIAPSFWTLKKIKTRVEHSNFESLYLNNFVTGCTILARSDYIYRVLPFPKDDEHFIHDYWTALLISNCDKITYIDEPLVKYRQHGNNSVGSSRKSDAINDFDELRNMFIDIKINHFKVLKENEEKFTGDYFKNHTDKAIKYFDRLKKVKHFNFIGWAFYADLYQHESLLYRLENFCILNLPTIGRTIFKMRKKMQERREAKKNAVASGEKPKKESKFLKKNK